MDSTQDLQIEGTVLTGSKNLETLILQEEFANSIGTDDDIRNMFCILIHVK